MSSFINIKPQILYAPMLATFGGGSSRGFGRGIGGGSLYDFSGGLHLVPQISAISSGADHRFGLYNFNEYRPDLAPTHGSGYARPDQTEGATKQSPVHGSNYIHWESSNKLIWWTAPETRDYNFIVSGSQGGSGIQVTDLYGGSGAKIEGKFQAVAGEVFYIGVGLFRVNDRNTGNTNYGQGGGGASFIAKATSDTTSIGSANASSIANLVVIAGGGGGSGGTSWSQYSPGGRASYSVGATNLSQFSNSNGLYSVANFHTPMQAGMVVNTRAGGGGVGGNGQAFNSGSNGLGASGPSPSITLYGYADRSTTAAANAGSAYNTKNYNGAAGGGGWLQTGMAGNNGGAGGQYIYGGGAGGNASTAESEGGFLGGGGARNTSGGGGGGFIGGSGGYWASETWNPSPYTLGYNTNTSHGFKGNSAGRGGVGGTSYVNWSTGSDTGSRVTEVTSAGTNGITTYNSEWVGYVSIT